jgi:hypothetical protein
MVVSPFSLREDYWETFELQKQDIEFLYNYLMDVENPLPSNELLTALLKERIYQEKLNIDKQRSSGGVVYRPKDRYTSGQSIVFPALGWKRGQITAVRSGVNPDIENFEVVQVTFADGDRREFASGIESHKLNQPHEIREEDEGLDYNHVMDFYGDGLLQQLELDLNKDPDFVRIAGRWFPRALLVDINVGHLNLAEAVLDMAGGGPLSTPSLLEQIGLTTNVNSKLVEFSLNLALQEDPRFDEVGPAGEVVWYLHRLEPEGVLQVPVSLRYQELEYNPGLLTEEMVNLEKKLDDELSPISEKYPSSNEVQLTLIFPHWRSGTLPLSPRMGNLFPTAYESPRIRFTLVDGETNQKFPAWVVRSHRYVYGLRDWYESKGIIPGSLIRIRKGKNPGEVIVQCDSQRGVRDWIRSVLVGSDGGLVFAMLKQVVTAAYDDRMTIAVPDPTALDQIWKQGQKDRTPFERIVVNTVRELTKLNPQSHVHASELYAAINVIRRCPPGPILSLLASRPWFIHVGDLHFRFDDSEKA